MQLRPTDAVRACHAGAGVLRRATALPVAMSALSAAIRDWVSTFLSQVSARPSLGRTRSTSAPSRRHRAFVGAGARPVPLHSTIRAHIALGTPTPSRTHNREPRLWRRPVHIRTARRRHARSSGVRRRSVVRGAVKPMPALAGSRHLLVGFVYGKVGDWRGDVTNKDCQRMAIPLTLGV
jgi:hypothetical protein